MCGAQLPIRHRQASIHDLRVVILKLEIYGRVSVHPLEAAPHFWEINLLTGMTRISASRCIA
jgi:hypothetical protein